ncbi:VWA domain-containing protein [Roseibium sp. RKSG952]|uniref:VWA domain-containing protein n=1 Tax=Roseibium sp. RKSG952 TaxID=2529384 RepID=UPI0012BB798D|nr:VWA domain-containing protein [Roseibium sp. RKSG952]MTH97728.1 VWA domain-containing protein [Roseibium sp. RKSG952]
MSKSPIDKTGSGPSLKSRSGHSPPQSSSASDVAAFLKAAKQIDPEGRGRLVFALDATMSRQPTWDQACHIQADMFREAGKISGLSIKLVYFRGFNECRASRWFTDAGELAGAMSRIDCRGGRTQIRKVLAAAIEAARDSKISAVVYVGDCMEEDIDKLCHRAGELALFGVPVFLFQEGRDPVAEQAFREIARITKGAYCRFDAGSARHLADLLKAVAIYASGGRQALTALGKSGHSGARLLIGQMK